jgi:hypothetical protein
MKDTCAEVRPWLSAYFDGELASRDRRRVEHHVTHCKICSSILDDLGQIDDSLSEEAYRTDPGAGYFKALKARLRQRFDFASARQEWMPEPKPPQHRSRLLPLRRVHAARAAAAIVIIAAVGGVLHLIGTAPLQPRFDVSKIAPADHGVSALPEVAAPATRKSVPAPAASNGTAPGGESPSSSQPAPAANGASRSGQPGGAVRTTGPTEGAGEADGGRVESASPPGNVTQEVGDHPVSQTWGAVRGRTVSPQSEPIALAVPPRAQGREQGSAAKGAVAPGNGSPLKPDRSEVAQYLRALESPAPRDDAMKFGAVPPPKEQARDSSQAAAPPDASLLLASAADPLLPDSLWTESWLATARVRARDALISSARVDCRSALLAYWRVGNRNGRDLFPDQRARAAAYAADLDRIMALLRCASPE